MSKLFELVSDGIGEIVESGCNSRTSTKLSREAFFSLAYMGEMMNPHNMPMKEHEFAARCINLVGHACQVMNTRNDNFNQTELYLVCQKFINTICDEFGMDENDFQRIYWVARIDDKLPLE